MTPSPLERLHARAKAGKRSKYGNRKTVMLGVKFDSKREARCWPGLLLRLKAGEIRNLSRQNTYELVVNGVPIGVYRSDFEWDEGYTSLMTLKHVVADAKGFRTREYRMKRALMKALHNIDILEL